MLRSSGPYGEHAVRGLAEDALQEAPEHNVGLCDSAVTEAGLGGAPSQWGGCGMGLAAMPSSPLCCDVSRGHQLALQSGVVEAVILGRHHHDPESLPYEVPGKHKARAKASFIYKA